MSNGGPLALAHDSARELEEFTAAASVAFADESPSGVQSLSELGPRLLGEFSQAVLERRETEERWLKDLRQYRGLYDPDVLAAIGPTRSKAFVRKTRVKVKTIDSRIADLLFPQGAEKNWTIEPTPKPSISPEKREEIKKAMQQATMQQQAAMQQQQAQQMQASGQQAPAQPAQMQPPEIPEDMIDAAAIEFAKATSKAMSKTIEDQLTEAGYKDACIEAIHSGHLYGTGILKGPLVDKRVRTRFEQDDKNPKKWNPVSESYITPFVEAVPIWRWYPDMTASKLEDCRYVFERHLMTRSKLADLAGRKSFDGTKIRNYINSHPRGEIRGQTIDNEIKVIGDRNASQAIDDGSYEVLERWGYIPGQDLKLAGVEVPEERIHEAFFSNVWLLPNGDVIRAVLQPITGVTWPYHIYSFDKDETSIFCEGIASIMRDDQTNLNAAVRMMLDNGALTSAPMLEVNSTLLSAYDNITEIAPWKIWNRNSQSPGENAIRAIDLPNHLSELRTIAEMFETSADETTAIPRYMTGENVSSGAAGTASGMSMLMGAANIVIKDLVTAWDSGVTKTFLESLYHWNMQFNPDDHIKGDFDVKARGAASLVAKEVRARQLAEFTASVSNQFDAPFIKRETLLRQRAEANELADVIKTAEEVQAEGANGAQAQQQQMAEAQMKMEMAIKQAQVAKLAAETSRIEAETALAKVKAIDIRVESIFAALQAAGVAVQNPHIAPAGDEIWRSAGGTDITQDAAIGEIMGPEVQGQDAQQSVVAQQSTSQGAQPQTGRVGLHAGIHTPQIE